MALIVSVIIPAYNVDQYIKECLDSVLGQTIQDIEVIVINDGSTDATLSILKEYELIDTRIQVFSQINSGLSAARNVGLDVAKGEYVVFLDSDDWLTSSDALEKMVYAIRVSKSDFVQCSFEFVHGTHHSIYHVERRNNLVGDEILKDTILIRNIYTAVWNKIYSRKFIEINKLRFLEGLINEDTAFSIMVAAHAKRVGFLDKTVYSSREREGSISRSSFKKMFKSMHEIFVITKKYLQENGKYSENIDVIFEGRYKRSMLYNLLQSAQRNKYRQFQSDWLFCMKNTDYMIESNSRYSEYMPLPNRVLYHVSKHPKVFFLLFRLLNKLGIKMH